MQITDALLTLALLSVGINAAPAPLNINLGAYSPALVVGDGALTFSGGAEGGAGEGAGKGKGNGGGKGTGGAGGKNTEAGGGAAAAAGLAAQRGVIAGRDAPRVEKRQLSGFDRALTFAEAALTKGPKVQLGNGEGGAGVGIIVDNNPVAAGGAAGGGAAGGGAGAGEGAGKGKGGGKGNGTGGAAGAGGAAARAA